MEIFKLSVMFQIPPSIKKRSLDVLGYVSYPYLKSHSVFAVYLSHIENEIEKTRGGGGVNISWEIEEKSRSPNKKLITNLNCTIFHSVAEPFDFGAASAPWSRL